MKIRKVAPQPEPPTHLLAVNRHEMNAIRRAAETYVQDNSRAPHYKDALHEIVIEINKALAV